MLLNKFRLICFCLLNKENQLKDLTNKLKQNEQKLNILNDEYNEVNDIMEDYPAYQAGIRVGDRITAINKEKVYFIQDIKLMLITETADEWVV